MVFDETDTKAFRELFIGLREGSNTGTQLWAEAAAPDLFSDILRWVPTNQIGQAIEPVLQ